MGHGTNLSTKKFAIKIERDSITCYIYVKDICKVFLLEAQFENRFKLWTKVRVYYTCNQIGRRRCSAIAVCHLSKHPS